MAEIAPTLPQSSSTCQTIFIPVSRGLPKSAGIPLNARIVHPIRDQSPSMEGSANNDQTKPESAPQTPLPSAQPESQQYGRHTDGNSTSVGHIHAPPKARPVGWKHLSNGAKWAIIKAITSEYSFSQAACNILRLHSIQLAEFVGLYNREWMIQFRYEKRNMSQSPDYNIRQPSTSTRLIIPPDIAKARRFLQSRGLDGFLSKFAEWGRNSLGFIPLPIEPEVWCASFRILLGYPMTTWVAYIDPHLLVRSRDSSDGVKPDPQSVQELDFGPFGPWWQSAPHMWAMLEKIKFSDLPSGKKAKNKNTANKMRQSRAGETTCKATTVNTRKAPSTLVHTLPSPPSEPTSPAPLHTAKQTTAPMEGSSEHLTDTTGSSSTPDKQSKPCHATSATKATVNARNGPKLPQMITRRTSERKRKRVVDDDGEFVQ